jgi:FMN phosphatase YigB (HAD superfamily)
MVNEDRTIQTRVVFFDLGQTLVTGAAWSSRRLLATRLQLNEKQTKRVGRMIMTLPQVSPGAVAAALCRVLPDKDPNQVGSVLLDLWQEQTACARTIPGATARLQGLKQMGLKLGVISNTWHPFYQGVRDTCPEIMELMDYQWLSYQVGLKKPRLDLFYYAIEKTGAPAASCWMVGDTYELDMEPAAQAGMRTLWVLNRPEREKALLVEVLRGKKPRPDWTVQDLTEVLAFFQGRRGS